jgi:hypothetical protein
MAHGSWKITRISSRITERAYDKMEPPEACR